MNHKYLFIASIIVIKLIVIGYIFWNRNSSVHQDINQQVVTAQQETQSIENKVDLASLPFMEMLRQRKYESGEIKIEETTSKSNSFTSYLISYNSDGLTIYGAMNIPDGKGPFPVIVLNHGYYSPSSFKSGDGTQSIATILANNGYITVASDYRGHGQSDNDMEGRGGHRPEYSIDVLNLIASIKSIPQANPDRIGMWGHSMGGEVSLRAIEATDQIKALVLWAPTSGNAADNHGFYGGRKDRPTSTPEMEGISPINFLQYITTPISLHQGSEDVEVNPEWSKELNDALKKEGKSVEYFEYEGQDHNFRNLGWDEISKRTIAFFNKYL